MTESGTPPTGPTLEFLVELLEEPAGLETGRMFGYPALYLVDSERRTAAGRPKRHLLLTLTDGGVAVRVGDRLQEELIGEPAIEPFAPYHMAALAGWVLIRRATPADYTQDRELLLEALANLG